MKNRFLLGMIIVAVVALIAQTAFAKLPSWDTVNTKKSRFKVLKQFNQAAVLDVETGLVWEQSPSATQGDWFAANNACNTKVVSDRLGWRLPTIQELTSLIDPNTTNPSLQADHPFSNVAGPYWAATTLASDDAQAWRVNFTTGNVGLNTKATATLSAWCVRGASGVDAQ
jgi:hypothetical protein